MELAARLSLDTILKSDNVAESIKEADLGAIANAAIDGYMADEASRSEWAGRYAEVMKLALQVKEEKTFPWQHASNVKFPLLTLAAVQFHARAYPALIPSDRVVGCQVIGEDPDGKKALRAARVSGHMSYQLMEEDDGWEEGMDKALLIEALVGNAFKKTYYDPVAEKKRSILVLSKDLVVDYYTKNLLECRRITQCLELYRNDIEERVREGIYLPLPEGAQPQPPADGPIEAATDERQGVTDGENVDAPFTILEQHRFLDLDGDGYDEPYVVTVCESTRTVLRIVPRFTRLDIKWSKDETPSIISITPEQYFTKYTFIPAPDGGFYDMGFGALLGATNDAVDTLINQLIDGGTMSTLGGGFLGKGVKVRGGNYAFEPGEWKRVDSTGEDLAKGIYPLPRIEPSTVLLQLLMLLLDFGTKLGGATDPMVGENPGQNTPAETSRNTIEQGRKVFNAIYKRNYRAMKEEFRKLYRLNFLYPPTNGKYDYVMQGEGGTATVADYSPDAKGVVPTADPYVSSDEQMAAQANDLMAILASPLGQMLSPQEVLKRVLDSRHVGNQQALVKPPQPPQPPPPDPKIVVAQIQAQTAKDNLQYEYTKLLNQSLKDQAETAEEQRVNDAKINQLESQAALFQAQASGQADNAQIAMIDAQIGAAKIRQEGLNAQMAEIQSRRQHAIDLLEHARNVKKDAADAANASRVG